MISIWHENMQVKVILWVFKNLATMLKSLSFIQFHCLFWVKKMEKQNFDYENWVTPWLNDRNISTQDVAALLSATCRVHSATLSRRVATCCNTLDVVGSSLKTVKFFMQHFLLLHDEVVWPGSCNIVAQEPAH